MAIKKKRDFNQLIILDLLSSKRRILRLRLAKKNRKKRSCWFYIGRTDLWWQNLILNITPKEAYKKNFRLDKNSFFELVSLLEPYISPDSYSPNIRAITPEKKVAITLYYLKDSGTLNITANTFGIAVCTTSAVIFEVCNAIVKYIGPSFVNLPKNKQQMREKISEFESKFGMIQVFGCVDGTHIPIVCPTNHSQDYFCYKQYYSLQVQAVCDYKGSFLDVECMWPGSVHDAKVFSNSSINTNLRSSRLPGTFQTITKNKIKVPCYLIGDPAYPLLPHCMKEYSTCKKNDEVIFNSMLRTARNPIECAFGRLKARWKILTKKMDLKLEKIPTVIYACFILHNFCERHSICIDEELVKIQVEVINENEKNFRNLPDPIFSCIDGEGEVIRKALTEYISENYVQKQTVYTK
ncbi:uncharacterized protein LOC101235978 [Hydra vulgaris]|uniref:uncharacterized protein LOC101235978 n=1 Tax=Hydra vulgaris TaxID=6087 RepID=UPI001F5F8BD5|nr:protein ANTAGONIST OF LIKE HETEROCHROMATIN PROTEIN 1-like [Hydra vulgaris]